MTVTGRNPPKRATSASKAKAFVATCSADEIARQSRVDELRRMVAAGEYRVEPEELAVSILRRALVAKQG
jgi:anti-sigma28 factor (negative regulator of flagellin synthesis)